MDARRSLLGVAVALTLGAAMIHVWAMPAHFGEWWLYGALFLLVASLQGYYGVALWRWPGRSVFIFGMGGNLAIVAFYLLTRTVGVPFGPHVGEVEAVGVSWISPRRRVRWRSSSRWPCSTGWVRGCPYGRRKSLWQRVGRRPPLSRVGISCG
jgi:hypothetical protein